MTNEEEQKKVATGVTDGSIRGCMTQDEIIEMAREALKQEPREDWNSTAWVFADETLQAFAKLVAEAEREACAKISDDADGYSRFVNQFISKRIRARGEA